MAPGLLHPEARDAAVPADYGTLNFFDQTASHVLDRHHRPPQTAILPQKTGPVIDVLYSAAGNRADEAWYVNGIVGYDFEIGDSKGYQRQLQGTGFQPCYGAVSSRRSAPTPATPTSSTRATTKAWSSPTATTRCSRSALEYANDTTAPVVGTRRDVGRQARTYSVKFTTNEASSIYYTTDGSTPTTASTEWKPNAAARAAGCRSTSPPGRSLSGSASDFKGNTSAVKAQVLGQTDTTGTVGGSVAATLSLSLGAAAQFGAFTPGIAKPYLASTTATVISTAGDATLSVADPSSDNTGHLVNGTFALPQPLQARARNAANTGTAYNNVGSSASPLNLLTYAGADRPTTPCRWTSASRSTPLTRSARARTARR